MSEIPDMERRLREFAAAPDDADWNDVVRRADMRLPAPRFTRRRLAVVLAAAAVVAGSLAVFVPGHATRSSAPAGRHGPTNPSGPTGSTGGGGDVGHFYRPPQITVGELRAEAPYIPLPDSKLANDSNVKFAWFDAEDLTGGVDYSSGIRLTWEQDVLVGDATVYSAGPVIDGIPSLIPAHGTNTLYLQVLPNTAVIFYGPGSEDDLIDAAKTLSTGALSPDGALPPADLSNPQGSNNVTRGYFQQHVLENWAAGVMLNPVPAESIADAANSLAFQPVAPSALGEPSAILHTDPATAPSDDRVLSLRYDDPSMGRYWLLERPSHSDTSLLLREAVFDCKSIQSSAAPCDAYASMLDVDGTQVLVINGWGGANLKLVAWVENGVYFEVVGLPPFGGAGYAVSVAKTVVAAAAAR